ncbi:cupin domain-containing protein [Oleomonas cavernae]|uniref:Cupin domain-containing protein n=1 Tax=Oleomonas cavernae TaxID=2320859 RepID=A0A418WCW1_9PROT|nr:cupin domain-containing protein [Oleomonas cavernae]
MSPAIFTHRSAKPIAEVDAPWPGTAIAGTPQTVTLNGYASADGKKLMGTWQSTPGTWAIDYDSWEYCHLLEGHCVITAEGRDPVHLRAGDIFIVEPGTKGTWEVLETIRKYYVFVLAD